MFNYFITYHFSTILLYISIIIGATFFASLSQFSPNKKVEQNYRELSYKNKSTMGWYLVSFFILAFFACNAGVGTDKESYKLFFRVTDIDSPYEYFEPGFNLVIIIIKLFTNNDQLFLVILSLITIAFTYKGIWSYRNEISVGWAVFIYASQYYFQGYNLMRMYFAMSILILGTPFLKKESYGKYFILMLVAAMCHYSVFVAVVAYILSLWLYKKSKITLNTKFIILCIGILFITLIAFRVLIVLINSIEVFSGKYSGYLEGLGELHIGGKVFFNLIPFIFIMLFASYTEKRKFFFSIGAGYFFVTLIISIMSYSIPMIGRTLLCLHLPVVILLPLELKQMGNRVRTSGDASIKIKIGHSRLIFPYYLIKIGIGIYFILAMGLYFYGYLELDGIDKFSFFWSE